MYLRRKDQKNFEIKKMAQQMAKSNTAYIVVCSELLIRRSRYRILTCVNFSRALHPPSRVISDRNPSL